MSSVLLPLQPRGMGTGQVESFASYFGRLAQLHTCSLYQLARLLSSWEAGEPGRRVTLKGSTLYMTKGAGMSSCGVCVEAYVDAVEHAMCVDNLRRCTLIPIRCALSPQRVESVRGARAWCEQCFRDDLDSGSAVYDRLLWTLQAITRCPEHRIELRTTCPACGVTQSHPHRSGNPSLCWRCERSLIGPALQLRPATEPALGEHDLFELVAAIARGGPVIQVDNPFHEFQRALDSILSPVATIVAGVARVNGSARARGAEVKPTLRTMLRRAHAAGVTVLQVLEDPEGAAAVAGQLIFDERAIAATAKARRPAEVLAKVRRAMQLELKKPRSEQIPRIERLASRCGVSEGFIRHRLTRLVRDYQSHRVAASVSLTNARLARCRAALSDPALAMKYVARAETLREGARQLAADTDCPIAVARRELRRHRAKCACRAGVR